MWVLFILFFYCKGWSWSKALRFVELTKRISITWYRCPFTHNQKRTEFNTFFPFFEFFVDFFFWALQKCRHKPPQKIEKRTKEKTWRKTNTRKKKKKHGGKKRTSKKNMADFFLCSHPLLFQVCFAQLFFFFFFFFFFLTKKRTREKEVKFFFFFFFFFLRW